MELYPLCVTHWATLPLPQEESSPFLLLFVCFGLVCFVFALGFVLNMVLFGGEVEGAEGDMKGWGDKQD